MKGWGAFIGGLALGVGAATVVVQRKRIFAMFQGPLGAEPAAVDPTTMAGAAIRQLRRYAFASSQDKSPIVGITHASYALILLDTLEETLGRDAIKKAGYDPVSVRAFITGLQDKHAKALEHADPYLQQAMAIERGDGKPPPGLVFAGIGAAPRGA